MLADQEGGGDDGYVVGGSTGAGVGAPVGATVGYPVPTRTRASCAHASPAAPLDVRRQSTTSYPVTSWLPSSAGFSHVTCREQTVSAPVIAAASPAATHVFLLSTRSKRSGAALVRAASPQQAVLVWGGGEG